MGMDVQKSIGTQNIVKKENMGTKNQAEKKSDTIFEEVSNNDLSLLGDVFGTLALGFAALRTCDVANGLKDLKDAVINNAQMNRSRRHNIFQMKFKSAKWQIPLSLAVAAAAFTFSKCCKDA